MRTHAIHLRAFKLNQRLRTECSGRGEDSRELYCDGLLDTALVLDRMAGDDAPLVRAGLQEGSHFEVQLSFHPDSASPREEEGASGLPGFLSFYGGTGGPFTVALSVRLPVATFERLWREPERVQELTLRGVCDLEDGELFVKTREPGEFLPRPLSIDWLYFQSARSTDAAWVEFRRGHYLRDVFRSLHFDRTWRSQVQCICNELADSIAKLDSRQERQDLVGRAAEVIENARLAFREPLSGTSQTYLDNAFALKRLEFQDHIRGFEQARKDELQQQYDTLWRHFKLSDVVASGEEAAGPSKYGLRCSQDEIDALAQKYLELAPARSPTLEWLLVDALVFGECLGFGQYLHSDQTLFGTRVAAALKPPKTSHVLRRSLGLSAGALAGEGTMLAGSFAIAWVVTGGQEVAAWVVMTGLTATRWLRKALASPKDEPHKRYLVLLARMEQACEELRHPHFNAGSVRHQLHALLLEGVSFRPGVFNLLDRRIELEMPAGPLLSRLVALG